MAKVVTKLSTRGQVVIPKEIRERNCWSPGEAFVVEEREGGILLRPAGASASLEPEDLLGVTGYRGPRKTLEEMDEAVARGARESR